VQRRQETTEYSVFSSDLANMSSINLESPYQVPLLPSRNFNPITKSESEKPRPDLPFEDSEAGFPSQYQQLLSRKKSFNIKMGYFSYANKHFPKALVDHFRQRINTFEKIDDQTAPECPRVIYRNLSVRAEEEMRKPRTHALATLASIDNSEERRSKLKRQENYKKLKRLKRNLEGL